MLRLLRIRNLALIRELEIEFGSGLNLLTGETGSGKSILIDALGLVLGARAQQDMIRADCDAAIVEGLFEIAGCRAAAALVEEAGFTAEDQTLLVRREISLSGRGRVFINNNLSTLQFLKTLGEKLAAIHGQQEQQSLLDLATHRRWLDEFGQNRQLREETRTRCRALRETARRLEEIATSSAQRLRRIDMLRFQLAEIEKVNPRPGEKEELEKERDLLTNREHILALTTEAYTLLYESEAAVLSGLNRLGRLCRELGAFDPDWNARRETVEECRFRLEDVAYAARDYAEAGDFSADRLEAVHERLDALEKLIRKYGAAEGSAEEVLAYGQKSAEELERLLAATDEAEQLTERFTRELQAYEECAGRLSAKRRQDAPAFEQAIRGEFAALAMERMRLRVHFHARGRDERDARAQTAGQEIEQKDKSAAAPGEYRRLPADYGPDGMDKVEFLIAPNQGEEMRPLAKIASGGELSRLMLAIKSLCGRDDEDRTLVFDEVDAGIGGRVAEAVGKRLQGIATGSQVLCVTHLAQVAAFAARHFNVRKDTVGERTETSVRELRGGDRTEELARMLGGETITEATRRVAAEMLERSQAKEAGEKKKPRSK